MLVYLSVYRYADACDSPPAQIHENLAKLWEEIKILTKPQAVELSLEPEQSSGEPLLAKLNIFSRPSTLRVVFLHEYNAQNSAWVRRHQRGINALQKAFPDRLTIIRRENVGPEVDAEQILEQEAHDHADCGVYDQHPDAPRLPEGGSSAPQDPLFELLAQCAPPAGAHLLPPHL